MNQGKDHGDGLRHPEAEVAILQQGVVAPPQDAAARDNGGEPNDAVLPPAVGNTVRHSIHLGRQCKNSWLCEETSLAARIQTTAAAASSAPAWHALPEGVRGVFERGTCQARVRVRPQEASDSTVGGSRGATNRGHAPKGTVARWCRACTPTCNRASRAIRAGKLCWPRRVVPISTTMRRSSTPAGSARSARAEPTIGSRPPRRKRCLLGAATLGGHGRAAQRRRRELQPQRGGGELRHAGHPGGRVSTTAPSRSSVGSASAAVSGVVGAFHGAKVGGRQMFGAIGQEELAVQAQASGLGRC